MKKNVKYSDSIDLTTDIFGKVANHLSLTLMRISRLFTGPNQVPDFHITLRTLIIVDINDCEINYFCLKSLTNVVKMRCSYLNRNNKCCKATRTACAVRYCHSYCRLQSMSKYLCQSSFFEK